MILDMRYKPLVPWQPDLSPDAPEVQRNLDTGKDVYKSDYYVPVAPEAPIPVLKRHDRRAKHTTSAFWKLGRTGRGPLPIAYWIDRVTGVITWFAIRCELFDDVDLVVPSGRWTGSERQVSDARMWFRHHGLALHADLKGPARPLAYPVSPEKQRRYARAA